MKLYHISTNNCLLRCYRNKNLPCDTSMCKSCGWDDSEHKRRLKLADENGLTLCNDGLFRLIITKRSCL